MSDHSELHPEGSSGASPQKDGGMIRTLRENEKSFNALPALKRTGILLAAVIAALAVGSVFLLAVGADPAEAYYHMLIRPLTKITYLGEISIYFVPLLLIGLGVSVTFHAKLNNLGGGGQMLFGALGMTLMAVPPVSNVLGDAALPAGILAAVLMGALWAAIAGFFRVKFSSSEIIITLMLNYIAEEFISWMCTKPLRVGAEPQSAKLSVTIPKIVAGSRITWAAVIALALAAVYWLVIYRTRYGYHLRVLGGSEKAARYSGASPAKLRLSAMIISGAFCGLAGAMQIAGNTQRLMEGVAGDFGFAGIVVAMLGSLHPLGVVAAAFFMALLSAGSVTMQVKTGISTSFTSVIEALIVLFILLGMALSGRAARRKR